jgi:hypothetical protein
LPIPPIYLLAEHIANQVDPVKKAFNLTMVCHTFAKNEWVFVKRIDDIREGLNKFIVKML